MDDIFIPLDETNEQVMDPSLDNQKPSSGIGFLHKISNNLNNMNKRQGVALGVTVCAILLAIGVGFFIYSGLANNYYSPVRISERYVNMRAYTTEEIAIDYSNHLGTNVWKRIFDIAHDSNVFLDNCEELDDEMLRVKELEMEQWGDDYKYSFELIGKSELTSAELRDYREELQTIIAPFVTIVEESEDFDSADWGDLADDMDLSKADTKKIISLLSQLVEKFRRPDVTAGYELEIKQTVTGSELEEPEVTEITIIVLKVNGRWVTVDSFKKVYLVFLYTFYDALIVNF